MKMRNWCFVAVVTVLAAVSNGSSDVPDHSAAAHAPAAHVAAKETPAHVDAPAPAPAPASHAPAAADPHAPAPAAKAEAAPAPSPDEALKMLIEGNERYTSSLLEHPRGDALRRCDTFTNGQHPFAAILSCADSRAPVEMLFDQGIGDLFVVRVAGNVADTDEIGTIEYGAGHLHTPLILVMGHTKCGAVTAVAGGAKVSPNIAKLVDNIVPAVATARKNLPGAKGDTLLQAAIDANVMQSISDMLGNSEEIRELVEAGKVKIVGAVYDIHTGSVRWLGEHPRQHELLNGSLAASHANADTELMHKTPAADAHAAPAKPADPHAAPAKTVAKPTATKKPAAADTKTKTVAKDAHGAPAAAEHKATATKDKKTSDPHAAEEADASSDASKPAAPHETGGLKGMLIPGAFIGGATLASGMIFQLMKGRKAAAEPTKEAASEAPKAEAHG